MKWYHRPEVRSWLLFGVVLSLSVFIGCLGGGGGAGGGITGVAPMGSTLYGKLSIPDRQLAKGIPVEARNLSNQAITRIQSDAAGNFAFGTLVPGVYDLYAITGDAEVLFQKSIQVTSLDAKFVGDVSLLGLRDILLTNVSSSSAYLQFRSNQPCYSKVEFGEIGIDPIIMDVSRRYASSHEIDLTGLGPNRSYECRVKLNTNEGQEFTYYGVIITTSKTTGPTFYSLAINSGSFETRSTDVNLTMKAENVSSMRFGETDDLSAASWMPFANTYPFSFANRNDGKKKVFVQFQDINGNESPIIEDSIMMNSSGYTGIVVESGKPLTSKKEVSAALFAPGAVQMKISESVTLSGAYWEPFVSSKIFRLSSGDGLKSIYASFKGGTLDPIQVYSTSIMVDTTPPSGGMKINNGATKTGSTLVRLSFAFGNAPADMQLSNTSPPVATAAWIPYRKEMDWTLEAGAGAKSVYGNFRDAALNVLGPISAQIELDLTPPSGNSFEFRRLKDSASEIATYALPGSFPIYLHFSIADSSTASASYARTEEDAEAPASTSTGWVNFSTPFRPVALVEKDPFWAGTNKIWVRYGDDVGNFSTPVNKTFLYDGEQIIISPRSGKLFARESLSLNVTAKNVVGGVGTVNWSVVNGSGSLTTNSGLSTVFKSPDHIGAAIYPGIASPSEVVIRAASSFKPELTDVATITLLKKIDIVGYENTGTSRTEKYKFTIPPGKTQTIEVKALNVQFGGVKIGLEPVSGQVAIAAGSMKTIGSFTNYETEVSYTPPDTIFGVLDDLFTIAVDQDNSIVATFEIRVTDGPIVSPSSGEVQRHLPLRLSASLANQAANPITWQIGRSELGSFDPTDENVDVIQTSSPNNSVIFYASATRFTDFTDVFASDALGKVSSASVKVIPPVGFKLNPTATDAMPIVSAMVFTVDNFENFGTASATFKWEFRNATGTNPFFAADGNSYDDRGSLKITSPTTAEYQRPARQPSSIQSSLANRVEVRVTSLVDPLASRTSTITIVEPVQVKILRNFISKEIIASAATVAEVGAIQFYAEVTPITIGDTSVSWTVNNTAGNSTIGTIDDTGKYIAPDLVTIGQVEVRAASKYDPSKFASVTLSLSDFWIPVRGNMYDAITSAPISINSLVVNPYTASGQNFEVFSGSNGYGVWYREFSDIPGQIEPSGNFASAGGPWIGVTDLSNSRYQSDPKFLINKILVTPDQKVLAATGDGMWYIEKIADDPESFSATKLTPRTTPIVETNFLAATFNPRNSNEFYFGTNQGVYKVTVDFTNKTYDLGSYKLDTASSFRAFRETRLDSTASPAVPVSAWTDVLTENLIDATIKCLVYDGINDRIYAGGENSLFLVHNRTTTGNIVQTNDFVFTAPAPSVTRVFTAFNILSSNQPTQTKIPPPEGAIEICLDLTLDPNTTSTLWAAGSKGVFRSTDSGTNWEAKAFPGSVINTKCILVDPTNVINVMSGSEDGLYRSTDAGSLWKRIKSGLGNHKTINCLTQSSGEAGARRKVWVGTTGGVFIGKQSLDLE